jgi:iron(III) transport system ATP-binding protein
MPAHLDFTDVTHAYARTPVLQGVSFSVSPGMIACLLGASGCGKTTVLRCIAGFEPILGGTVALDGAVMSAKGVSVPPEKRHIGVVFQDFALFPHLTVAGNIAFGLHATAPAQREATWAENIHRNSQADNSSVWHWPARWRHVRSCCCSTSPSPTSTSRCANV